MAGTTSKLEARVDHVLHCFDALIASLSSGSQPLPPPNFEEACCPLFVTWHKTSRSSGERRLRGCIGTLEARQLRAALGEYALTSALRDRRFAPVEAKELPLLSCTVSLLHSFEPAEAHDAWEIGVHGLLIHFHDPQTGARRSATFLPEVPAHEQWDRLQTLDHLIRKAGYAGAPSAARARLRLTLYQSTAYSLTYEEFCKLREPGHGRRFHTRQQLVTVGAAQ